MPQKRLLIGQGALPLNDLRQTPLGRKLLTVPAFVQALPRKFAKLVTGLVIGSEMKHSRTICRCN